jgi:hypothetical protein
VKSEPEFIRLREEVLSIVHPAQEAHADRGGQDQPLQGAGEGSSVRISVVTVGVLFALWFAVTNLGW